MVLPLSLECSLGASRRGGAGHLRPEARGVGVGRRLVTRVLEEARVIGYRRVLLDTLPSMAEAIALYHSMGFSEIAPYRQNPIAGARFLALTV